MKILSISNVCLVGGLMVGLILAWSNATPQLITREHIVGGCCCITAKIKWCGGTFCTSGCGVCKNDPPGVRLCFNAGKKCTSLICEGPCQDYHCSDEQLCDGGTHIDFIRLKLKIRSIKC